MLRSLRTSEHAMQLQQTKIDTLANNLANVNSSGFKQVLERVRVKAEGGGMAPESQRAPAGGKNGEEVWGMWPADHRLEMVSSTDTRPGQLRATGRPTDLAVTGEGYFAVETENGERYTRDGGFRLDENRQLVTGAGQIVLGTGGPIVIEGEDWRIDNDGKVIADDATIAALKLVRFEDAAGLKHVGSNLFMAPDDLRVEDVPPEEINVQQGYLEGSNVDPIRTLVAMIEAQRAFEIESKVITTTDASLDKSINQLGRVQG